MKNAGGRLLRRAGKEQKMLKPNISRRESSRNSDIETRSYRPSRGKRARAQ
jgi:hypothetical protein